MVASCGLGLPVVVRMPPVLDDGTPFPTRYWLTCPLAVKRLGRVESGGGIAAAEEYLARDADEAARMEQAHVAYAAERDADLPPDVAMRPQGGVAGIREGGVKCLHAHYAHHAAGGDNPVGAMVAGDVEPLVCARPCVVASASTWVVNPQWREPHR